MVHTPVLLLLILALLVVVLDDRANSIAIANDIAIPGKILGNVAVFLSQTFTFLEVFLQIWNEINVLPMHF